MGHGVHEVCVFSLVFSPSAGLYYIYIYIYIIYIYVCVQDSVYK